MKYPDESYNLRIELDTKNFSCTPDEIREMEVALHSLAEVVREFPVSDLYITLIYHIPTKNFHVKTSLVLPRRTLFTGDRDEHFYPAYERCIRKLVKKVHAYKERLANVADQGKLYEGTHQEVEPTGTPDIQTLQQAVEAEDYAAFRQAVAVYEEPIRKRIGRWVQRYPALEADIDVRLTIADIVEEVFLNAFEHFHQHHAEVPFGDWLERLIDPSIRALMKHPDEELENINAVRALTETEPRDRFQDYQT